MRRFVFMVLLFSLASCLVACKDDGKAEKKMPPAYVKVMDVVARDVPWGSDFQATAAGSRSAEVRSRVQGVIQKRLYKEGDFIQKGQIMFQLERDHYEAVYEQAKAAFNNADREWKRVRPLYAANAVSQKERDAALSSYESTRASLRQAKVDLDYCQVVAPVSGFTSKECLTEGNLVSNTSLLTTINQTDPMNVDFSIVAIDHMYRQNLAREGRLRFPENGEYKARLRLLDGRMYETVGVVNFIDSQVSPTIGVIRARASFPNSEGIVMPGQYVRIFMDGDVLVKAILIPQPSVMITKTGNYVFILDNKNLPKRIPVRLGITIGNDYLVDSGLSGGERLIVDGILKVREGIPVRYDDPRAEKSAKSAK